MEISSLDDLDETSWKFQNDAARVAILSKFGDKLNELDEEVLDDVLMFIIDMLKTEDLIILLKNSKSFRNFFRSKLVYLLSPYEELIEEEDVSGKYIEILMFLEKFKNSGIDPQHRFEFIMVQSQERHIWNDFGITDEVLEDFSNLEFYNYDPIYFEKFRKLVEWILLDILDYFDLLDIVSA